MTINDGVIIGTTQVVDHGFPAYRYNLVILRDGYQRHEISQYETHVQRIITDLQSSTPFNEVLISNPLWNSINIYRVNVFSVDSGADDPTECGGTGSTVRTYFDATFCDDGTNRRSLTVDETTAITVANQQVPEWDMILVLVNSTIHGGTGGTVAVSSVASNFTSIVLHEIGHTLFDLADEYEYYEGCNSGETGHDKYPGDPIGDIDNPNVTLITHRDSIKWRDLILPSTPVPTTSNADCTQCDPQTSPVTSGTVGLFEGAYYFHCGVYRPEFDCLMRTIGAQFCAVCSEIIRHELSRRLGHPLLNGWHQPEDIQLVGDFMGLGHDQVLFIRNNAGGAGGRVLVADFSSGQPPGQIKYWENYGQSPLLNGWHQPEDIQLVGDFMGLGHDQVFFINNSFINGRVLVADFSSGQPPGQIKYWEFWNET